MRRALSLLALGITLALTAAESVFPTLTLTSIKAVDVTKSNKDQWSAKGYLNDPDGIFLEYSIEEGVITELVAGNNTVNEVIFAPNNCRMLNNDKGIVCRKEGARLTAKKTRRVPKEAITAAQKNNKTSSASSYFRISGVFRRQQFESTLTTPLTVLASTGGSAWEDEVTNYACKEKIGGKATKVFCKPDTAPSTQGPTPVPTEVPDVIWTLRGRLDGEGGAKSIASSGDGTVRVGHQPHRRQERRRCPS